MKETFFSILSCIVVFTIMLSGCSSSQNHNDLKSGELQSSEVTSVHDNYMTESNSETEYQTHSITNEQSSETDGSSLNGESLPEYPDNTNSSNTQHTEPSVESNFPEKQSEESTGLEERTVNKMNLKIGNNNFTATLENNAAVVALVKILRETPIVLQMSDYSGFEKVGSLGTSLPTSNKQTTTQAGDIVLYNGNQIVIFYGSNSWNYTRLGKIDDLSGWKDALGRGDVTVTFSID